MSERKMTFTLDRWNIQGYAQDAYEAATGERADVTLLETNITVSGDRTTITLVHPRDTSRVFELVVTACALDTATIVRDTLVPADGKDEIFRNDFLFGLEKEYEAALYFHPTQITYRYWVTKFGNPIGVSGKDIGKWMLFYPHSELDRMWQSFHDLFDSGNLPGVIGLKCSTGKSNARASDKNEGVIILYCSNSNDESHIMSTGRNILQYIGTYRSPFIYYKTDDQTHMGTRATGTTRNHTYKLRT